MAKVTINDIARECGVSITTVSLVLNGHPRISKKTADRVMEMVKRCGYQPNSQARGLAAKSSERISLVVPDLDLLFTNTCIQEITHGIHEGAADQHYHLLLETLDREAIHSGDYIRQLKSFHSDGALFLGNPSTENAFRAFSMESGPYLILNQTFPFEVNFLSADYETAGKLAAEHVMERGHTVIGCITAEDSDNAVAFKEALSDTLGKQGTIHAFNYSMKTMMDMHAIETCLKKYPAITLLVFDDDQPAVEAIQRLPDRGISIPKDVSIMGAGNIRCSSSVVPSLTTVDLKLRELGRASISSVLKLFQKDSESIQLYTEPKLIVRTSTVKGSS